MQKRLLGYRPNSKEKQERPRKPQQKPNKRDLRLLPLKKNVKDKLKKPESKEYVKRKLKDKD